MDGRRCAQNSMNGSHSLPLDPVVDFSALPRAALERLAGHYGVEASRGCELPELAMAVRDAFAREAVDEEQVMLSLLQRERREAKQASSEVYHKRAREMTAKTTARSSHSGTHRSIEVRQHIPRPLGTTAGRQAGTHHVHNPR